MARKKKDTTADRQPMELGELRKLLSEFMERYNSIENEISLLKEDQKNLIEEYSEQLDVKALKQAIRLVKLQNSVEHKDTFELYTTVLDQIMLGGTEQSS